MAEALAPAPDLRFKWVSAFARYRGRAAFNIVAGGRSGGMTISAVGREGAPLQLFQSDLDVLVADNYVITSLDINSDAYGLSQPHRSAQRA